MKSLEQIKELETLGFYECVELDCYSNERERAKEGIRVFAKDVFIIEFRRWYNTPKENPQVFKMEFSNADDVVKFINSFWANYSFFYFENESAF